MENSIKKNCSQNYVNKNKKMENRMHNACENKLKNKKEKKKRTILQ